MGASRKARVVIVGHSYLAAENRKNLRALAERGYDVHVLSPASWQDPLFDYAGPEAAASVASNERRTPYGITGPGYELRAIPLLAVPGLPASVQPLKGLMSTLRSLDPDVVHVERDAFTPLFAQVACAAKLVAPRAALVSTIKQNTYTSRNWAVDTTKDLLARALVPHTNQFIAVNQGVAAIYRDRFGAKESQITHCTQLGVDTDHFAPVSPERRAELRKRFSVPADALAIGYVGRLATEKGLADLVSAVDIARSESNSNLVLLLLGKGELEASLRVRARETPWLLPQGILPHGFVNEFLGCLDLFAMPSRVLPHHVEHDAHALMEAMAVGLPCVGTDCGAIPEVLNSAGTIVAPEAPSALARALLELATVPERRAELGSAARQRAAAEYSLQVVAERYERAYERALG